MAAEGRTCRRRPASTQAVLVSCGSLPSTGASFTPAATSSAACGSAPSSGAPKGGDRSRSTVASPPLEQRWFLLQRLLGCCGVPLAHTLEKLARFGRAREGSGRNDHHVAARADEKHLT